VTSDCAIIDPVLDLNESSASVRTESADQLLKLIRERGYRRANRRRGCTPARTRADDTIHRATRRRMLLRAQAADFGNNNCLADLGHGGARATGLITIALSCRVWRSFDNDY